MHHHYYLELWNHTLISIDDIIVAVFICWYVNHVHASDKLLLMASKQMIKY